MVLWFLGEAKGSNSRQTSWYGWHSRGEARGRKGYGRRGSVSCAARKGSSIKFRSSFSISEFTRGETRTTIFRGKCFSTGRSILALRFRKTAIPLTGVFLRYSTALFNMGAPLSLVRERITGLIGLFGVYPTKGLSAGICFSPSSTTYGCRITTSIVTTEFYKNKAPRPPRLAPHPPPPRGSWWLYFCKIWP